MNKPVSIILLCHNRWEDTRRCLESLKRSTPPGRFELLAFDNASTDDTLSNLRRFARGWPALRVIRNDRNIPFSEGVNKGMRAARGRYFLWLNNDTVLTPGWLDGLIRAAESEPWIGAAGPMTDHMAPPQQLSRRPFKNRRRAEPRETPYLGGFCFLLKRSAARRAGFLDELFHWGWEDIDYSLRLRQAGQRLVVARNVFIHHAGNRTIRTMERTGREASDLKNRRLISLKWWHAEPWRAEVRDLLERSPAPWAQPQPKTSALVVCAEDWPRVRACLEALRRGGAGSSREVLALDLSDDRLTKRLERLAEDWSELRVLGPWNHLPLALNRASHQAQGESLEIIFDASARRLKIPREAFERAGGFDERLSGALCVSDFRLRLSQAGLAVSDAVGAGSRARPGRSKAALSSVGDRELAARKWLPPGQDHALGLRPAASIVVACRGNSGESLRRLESARRSAGELSYEVLATVLGSGTCPSAIKSLARDWPQLRVLEAQGSVPVAKAINRAIRSALGEYIAILSEGTVASPGWLESLVAAAKAKPATGLVHVRDQCLLIPRHALFAVGELDDRLPDGLWALNYRLRTERRGYRVLAAEDSLVRVEAKP